MHTIEMKMLRWTQGKTKQKTNKKRKVRQCLFPLHNWIHPQLPALNTIVITFNGIPIPFNGIPFNGILNGILEITVNGILNGVVNCINFGSIMVNGIGLPLKGILKGILFTVERYTAER